jgi:prepilin-type N-terminal cleavage/methylation domain-containing protein
VNATHRDNGYTMLETLVSLAIITIMLTVLAGFYMQSTATNRRQADTQGATQYAVTAFERVSLLPGGALITGRTEHAVRSQERAPGVEAYLDPSKTRLVWQAADATDPPTALSLPTHPEPVTVDGVPSKFRQSWYVGDCWRPADGGDCVVATPQQQANRIRMYRIIVAVTWPSRDCAAGVCSYIAAMLTSTNSADPTFGL